MAQVALLGHAKPKSTKTKAHISKVLSDHAVANTWWAPSSLPCWLTEQCYAEQIQPQLKFLGWADRATSAAPEKNSLRSAHPHSEGIAYKPLCGEIAVCPGVGRMWPNKC